MESKYKSIKHIGEGAFSSVILALNIESGEKVAIKKMKKRRWKDTAAQAEIGALKKLHHDNIIRLLDVFREDYRSFLVFECMDCDLNELVVSRQGRRLPETVILDITYQVLNGLDFIHNNDFFHRDIKPENVLIRRHIMPGGPGGSSTIVVEAKIADFGLVHDMDFSRPLTDYISTRWYRAPEVLLNCSNYSAPIDVWAVGTIISELATLRPLFPGSNQIDQLRRIFEVLGTPRISAPTPGAGRAAIIDDDYDADFNGSDAKADGSWYEGAVHARKLGIAFVPSARKPLSSVVHGVSNELISLIDYILVLNPSARPTAKDALNYVSGLLDNALGEPNAQIEETSSDDMRVPQSSSPSSVLDDEDDVAGSTDATELSPKPRIGVCSMEIDPPQTVPIAEALKAQANKPDNANAPPNKPDDADTKVPAAESSSSDKSSVAETPKQSPPSNGQKAPYKRLPRIPPIASKQSKADESEAAEAAAPAAKSLKKQQHRQVTHFALQPAEENTQRSEGNEEEAANLKPRQANVQDGRISFSPHDSTFPKIQFKDTNAESADSAESMTPLPSPPAVTSRTSTEIKIVHGPHKEPLRDPRGDLSDIAVRQPVRTAVAKRIVLPHMRATTPVSASVPAPQIAPRFSNNSSNNSNRREEWPVDEGASGLPARTGGAPPSDSDRRKPQRLGYIQTSGPRINNLRARSQTVSSIGSIATSATHSIVLSPTSSNMMSESRYSSLYSEYSDQVAFSAENSVATEPTPPKDEAKRGLRIYAEANQSAIGKASLMSMLSQQQQQQQHSSSEDDGAAVVSSIANTLANAADFVPANSGRHIRKAPGVARTNGSDKRASDSTGLGQSNEIDAFIPLRSPKTQPATIGASAAHKNRPVVPAVSVASIASQQNTASNGVAPKQQQQQHGIMRGLRSRNGLGTPLIRRALSMRKKGSKEQKQQQQQQQGLRPDAINQFSFAAHNASAPPVPKLSKLQKGLAQNKQDSPLSGGYDMVSMDDGNSPLQPSHAIKRSKSALALKQPHHHKAEDDEADSRLNAAAAASAEGNMGADTPSLFSLQSSMAQLDLSSEMQTALAEEISLYGLDGLSIKESVADGGKKNEWISNIQFLRQRLADHNISVGDVTANGTKRNSTRKRRSSSSDMHLATNATLHGDTLSYKSSAIVKAAAAAAAAAAASVRSKEDALRDYLDNSGPVPPKAQVQLQTNNAKHGSSADDDMIAGLDAFAPVTFDAGKLFRQSLLAGSEKSPSSPFTPESARSPPEYMSTFNDVRRKYSTPKTLETAAAKSGSDQAAGGHWFLSKVKSALTGGGSSSGGGGGGGNSGGRHGSGSNVRKRQAATGGSSDGSDTAKSTGDGPLPRLDVDLGTTSLLTPDSMHRVPQHEDYTLVSQMSPFPKLQADGADPAASSATTAPASSDSAYYLIDYINGQHEDDSDRQPHKQQQKHSDIRAARRVVNKSTQMRQTQYEYNFGSQIFECLDKDLLLLKTDAFKDVEKEFERGVGRRVDSYGAATATATTAAAPSASAAGRKRQQQQQQHRHKGDPQTAHSVARRGRKKPTDVTGATAYTAAAINSIVAHNAKARSTKMSTSAVPSIADINASSLSWQLTTL